LPESTLNHEHYREILQHFMADFMGNFMAYLRRAAERNTSTPNRPGSNAQRSDNGSEMANSTSGNPRKRRIQGNDRDPSDDDSDDSSDDDDRDKKPNKISKFDKPPKKPCRPLACPYFRYDPVAFQEQICFNRGWPDMHRIK